MSGFDYFVSQGWSPVQAAGIMGNLHGESGLNPFAIGDGGSAFGIAQWHPDRQATFNRVMGIDIRRSSIDQQYQFVNWELNNTEKKAGNWLRSQTSLGGATNAFMRGYERPADGSSFGKRLAAGAKALAGGGDLLDKGKALLGSDAIQTGMNAVIPGSGAIMGLAEGIFGGGEDSCGMNPFCYLRQWITDSGFFQRLALAILAFIILFAAFYLMKSNVIEGATKGLVK